MLARLQNVFCPLWRNRNDDHSTSAASTYSINNDAYVLAPIDHPSSSLLSEISSLLEEKGIQIAYGVNGSPAQATFEAKRVVNQQDLGLDRANMLGQQGTLYTSSLALSLLSEGPEVGVECTHESWH